MHITKLAQKRPMIVYVLFLAIALLGLSAIPKIGLEKLPGISVPIFFIQTTWPGASAVQVDRAISHPISQAMHKLAGVKTTGSTSYPGFSNVRVRFDIGTNSVKAYQKIQMHINKIKSQLPKKSKAPEIVHFSVQEQPILWLALLDRYHRMQLLYDFAKNRLKPLFEKINGVGQVLINNAQVPSVNVQLSPEKMAAYQINIQNVVEAFKSENIMVPAGLVRVHQLNMMLDMDLTFRSLASVRDLNVANKNGVNIKLSQIADVRFSTPPAKESVLFNNHPAVGVGITRLVGVNAVAVIDDVLHSIKSQVSKTLPDGVSIKIARNTADSIMANIYGLSGAIFYSLLFASLVVLLFMRSVRATLIVVVAIPISLLAAIYAMNLFGYTFNMLTLLSLTLLVGVTVDDAIVVLENIYRTRKNQGLNAKQGALLGTQEVSFSVFASTITLILIFTSVVVMKGMMSVFFKSFALVVTTGVLTSYFVSMTLTPLLCQHFMSTKEPASRFFDRVKRITQGLQRHYKNLLILSLHWRSVVILLSVLMILPVTIVLKHLGSGFMPSRTDHAGLYVEIHSPASSSLRYTTAVAKKVAAQLLLSPAVSSVFTTIGAQSTTQAKLFVALAPFGKRDLPSYRLIEKFNEQFKMIAGAVITAKPAPMTQGVRQPLDFVVVGEDYASVRASARKLADHLQGHRSLGHVINHALPRQLSYQLEVDRNLANARGISSQMIADAVALFGGEIKVGRYFKQKNQTFYDIYLQPQNGSLINLQDIDKIYLFSKSGAMIPLSTIARLKPGSSFTAVRRSNTRYSVQFTSTPSISLSHAVKKVRDMAKGIVSAPNELLFVGQSNQSKTAMTSVRNAMIFIVISLYFVLMIQFSSLLQPAIVLLAQIFALIGALYSLALFNMSLNVFSLIGILLLMGLVSKNSILLISRANALREKKQLSIFESLVQAAPERMIPVIMTSLTIILAMAPVLLAKGPGARGQIVIANTIISGVTISTILSLLIVPALYSLAENGKLKIKHWVKRSS
jgi:HAE1 family hydrophobic/amphiphilic exporter-1